MELIKGLPDNVIGIIPVEYPASLLRG